MSNDGRGPRVALYMNIVHNIEMYHVFAHHPSIVVVDFAHHIHMCVICLNPVFVRRFPITHHARAVEFRRVFGVK